MLKTISVDAGRKEDVPKLIKIIATNTRKKALIFKKLEINNKIEAKEKLIKLNFRPNNFPFFDIHEPIGH